MLTANEKAQLVHLLDDVSDEFADHVRYFIHRAETPDPKFKDPERFERINETGSTKYGFNWLQAQRIAIATARSFGLEPDQYKTLIAAFALQIASVGANGYGSMSAYDVDVVLAAEKGEANGS